MELMQTLVETQRALFEDMHEMINDDNGSVRQGPKPNQCSNFRDFLDTEPPIFREAEEPLQADEWLNTIEHKFRLVKVADGMKTEYASQ
jgi:hypothetical protein